MTQTARPRARRTAPRAAPSPTPPRPRRRRDDIRERLLEAALVEFGAHGFDGASTRAIAERIDAHQPQIHYHFASKDALWTAAVDHLFGKLRRALGEAVPAAGTATPAAEREQARASARRAAPAFPDADLQLAENFAEGVRRFVRFAAAHPELNRIMVHEATAASPRLAWMTQQHVRPLHDAIRTAWSRLRQAGIAAPIDDAVIHYVLVGAASLPYVNSAELRLLGGGDPSAPAWVEAHAESLVATLLPNLPRRGPVAGPVTRRPRSRT